MCVLKFIKLLIMKKFLQVKFLMVFAIMFFQNVLIAQTTYTWSGGSTGDYQVAANWSPARTILSKGDALLFSNSVFVTNVPTQTIGQLILTNNSDVSLQATSGKSTILSVGSSDLSGDEISVPAGSSLTLTSNASGVTTETFTLGLANVAGVTSTIAGTLNLQPNSTTLPSDTVTFSLNTAYSVNQKVTNQGVLFLVDSAGTSAATGTGPGANAAGTVKNGTVVFRYVGTWFGNSYATAYKNVYDVHYGVTTITGTVNYAGLFTNTSKLGTSPNTLQFLSNSTFNNQRLEAAFPGGNSSHSVTNAPSYNNVNVTISGLVGSAGGGYFDELPASVNVFTINTPLLTGTSGSMGIRAYSLSDNSKTFTANTVNLAIGTGGAFQFINSQITTINIGSGGFTLSAGQFTLAANEGISMPTGDFNLSGTGNFTYFGQTVAGTVSMTVNNFNQSGASSNFNFNSYASGTSALTVNGNFNKSAGTFSTNYPGTISFTGSSSQLFSTNTSFGANTILELANTGSVGNNTVTLNSPLKLLGILKLTSGILVSTTTNFLTISTNGIIGGSDLSYVTGNIQYASSNTNPFTMPFGLNGQYYPITITPTSGTSVVFSVQYLPNTTNLSTLGFPLKSINPNGYYSIQTTTGSISATLSVMYNFSVGVVKNNSDLVLATYGTLGSLWSQLSAFPVATGDNTSGTISDGTAVLISTKAVSLALGSINSVSNLPVVLKSFNGNNTPNGNVLNWESEIETNLSSYQVEKLNPVLGEWIELGTIISKGTGSFYQFVDKESTNAETYRLKIIDKTGTFTFSKAITIFKDEKSAYVVYPNPFVANLTLDLKSKITAPIHFKLLDVLGRIVDRGTINQRITNLSFPSIKRGNYRLVLSDGREFNLTKGR